VNLVTREEKLPVELTLKAARKRQSKQTGFIHFCYESVPGEPHETIPLFENACFTLALFRSRLNEDIQEGKALLSKLLAFEIEGNFPVYLHEFPLRRDQFFSLKMISALLPILKNFSSILGEELLLKLSRTIDRIKSHISTMKKEGILPKSLQLKADALEGVMDVRLAPHSSDEWKEWLLAYFLWSKNEEEKEVFFSQLKENWNPYFCVFHGSKGRPLQEKNQPASSLCDLFMSIHTGILPKRLLEDHPIHLQAALLPFYAEWKPNIDINNEPLFLFHEVKDPFFTLAWGDASSVHTLVGVTNAIILEKAFQNNYLEVRYLLPLEHSAEESFDICLFCNKHSDHKILINDKQANTFQLGDIIKIVSKELVYEVRFLKLEGEGNFFGHLSFANRPGQLACRGDLRFEVYDWQIALRSIQRKATCQIKMELTILPVVKQEQQHFVEEQMQGCLQQHP